MSGYLLSEADLALTFCRLQFPIYLGFTMSIDKAKGEHMVNSMLDAPEWVVITVCIHLLLTMRFCISPILPLEKSITNWCS